MKNILCYKVVHSDGSIGGYSAGGAEKKAELLKGEGIGVKGGKIDLKRHGYRLSKS